MRRLVEDMRRTVARISLCGGVIFVVACGGTIDDRTASSRDVNQERPGWRADDVSNTNEDESSRTSGEGGDPSESSDDTDASSDDPQSTSSTLADICAPRPTSATLPDVPELPDRVRAIDCPDFELNTSETGDPQSRVVWTRDGDRITKRIVDENGYRRVRTTFRLDDSGTLRTIKRRNRMSPETEGGIWRTWTFDGEGRLVERTHVTKYRPEDESRDWRVDSRSKTVQTWRQGRLVERITTSRTQHDRSRTRRSWSYDETGRMTVGRVETDGQTYSVHWSYGSEGPTRVEHRLDGQMVAARTWTYRSSGHLKRRRLKIMPGGNDWSEIRRVLDGPLDQYALDITGAHGRYRRSNAAGEASGRALSRDCRALPSSMGFGYPTSKAEYRILWKDAGALSQIRELPYRNGRLNYYGSLPYRSGMWFGHYGSITDFPGPRALLSGEPSTLELRYDVEGRMTEQIVRVEGEIVQRRMRTFGPNGLRIDRLIWTKAANEVIAVIGPSSKGSYPRRHTLQFERDDRGRMTRRSLFFEGEEVGYQTFEYADAGYIDTIRVHVPMRKGYGDDYPEEFKSEPIQHTATYRRTLDDRGRPIRFEQEHHVDLRFGRSNVTTFDYSSHGLVERLSRPLDEPKADGYGLRKSYNDRGQLLRTTEIDNGVMQSAEVWRYATDGRRLERTNSKPDGPGRTRVFQYRCSPEEM